MQYYSEKETDEAHLPTYESFQDKQREVAFSRSLVARGLAVHEMPQYSPFDFFIERPGFQAIVEFKRRNHHSSKYPTTFIPAQKFVECRNWARGLDIPFYIFIQWQDEIRYCNGMSIAHSISVVGRKDRNFLDSRKLMIELDVRGFKHFSMRPNSDQAT